MGTSWDFKIMLLDLTADTHIKNKLSKKIEKNFITELLIIRY
jgi:hypothetical protein